MNKRPHFRKLARQLISAVDLAKNDASALTTLIHEIELRKKSKARLAPTLERAKKLLGDVHNNASRTIPTKNTEKHSPETSIKNEERLIESRSKNIVSLLNETTPAKFLLETSFRPWIGSRLIGRKSKTVKLTRKLLFAEMGGSQSTFNIGDSLNHRCQATHILNFSDHLGSRPRRSINCGRPTLPI